MKAVFLDYMSLAAEDLDLSGLNSHGLDITYHQHGEAEQTQQRIKGFDIVLTNKVLLSREHFELNPQLKLVVILATGTNNVDLDAAKEHGVRVCNIVDYSTASVVQLTFALMLALKTRLLDYHQAVQQGEWHNSPFFGLLDYPIDEVQGKILGIVGYGKIGKAVANIAEAFGMQVLVAESLSGEQNSGRVPLQQVLQQADIVSLHCPLTVQSNNLITLEQLALMKPQAILLNLARGGVVNETDLLQALQQQIIAAAATDVLTMEPPDHNQVLLQQTKPAQVAHPNLANRLIVTPHIGWASRQARQNLIDQVEKIIVAFQSGEQLNQVV